MMKKKITLAVHCALGALAVVGAPAMAQDTSAPAPATAADSTTDSQVVVVTGAARPQRRFDA